MREQRFDAELDRVEVAVIDEAQPRWLAFLGDGLDVLAVPPQFAGMAMPHDRLAPFLARRGIQVRRTLGAMVTHTYYNFDDPTVGGYTADKVALRCAAPWRWPWTAWPSSAWCSKGRRSRRSRSSRRIVTATTRSSSPR